MGRTKTLTLTKEQVAALNKGFKFGSCHRFRMRCQGVLLKAEGKTAKEISKIVGYGHTIVLKWVRNFEEFGIDGLREKGGRGVKPLMSSLDDESVRKAVARHRGSIKAAKAAWEKDSGRKVSDSTFKRFLELLAQDINV